MGKRLQSWKAGDIFAVPVSVDEMGLGQVISEEQPCMDSVLCAFFLDSFQTQSDVDSYVPSSNRLMSVQLTTRDLLDLGKWRVCKTCTPLDVTNLFPIVALRKNEYVGARIRGSKQMSELVSAYHRKSVWDDFHDPKYLDGLLLPGVQRPKGVILKKG